MSSWPQKATNNWSDLVVGGAYGEPILFKLYENDLIENGSFESVLSGWDGSGEREDFGEEAAHGNYVLSMENVTYMHTYFNRASSNNDGDMDSILFTGFLKATQGVSDGKVKVRVYCGDTDRISSPTKYVDLEILVDDSSMISGPDGLTQWVKFYLMADISEHTGDYVHFEVSCSTPGTINYYLDDLKAYEVKEIVELECPNVFKVTWQRKTDANYEMADGSNKDYVRGWRPVYELDYEYCSREQLVENIGITENGFNFLAPHKDSCNGEYVRMISDMNSSYFHNRFLGHTTSLPLIGIHLRKKKNVEYNANYFTLTEA